MNTMFFHKNTMRYASELVLDFCDGQQYLFMVSSYNKRDQQNISKARHEDTNSRMLLERSFTLNKVAMLMLI